MAVSCDSPPAEQSIVQGDGFEITISELDQLLRVAPAVVAKEQVKPARRAVLNALIDQKLLAETALAQGLDKDPNVFQAQEASKRSILAQAYINKLTEGSPQISTRQIEDYYLSHETAYANRVQYTIDEYVFRINDPRIIRNNAAIIDRIGLDQFLNHLKNSDQEIDRRLVTRTGDDLYNDKLLKRVSIKAGDTVIYAMPEGFHVGKIVAIRPVPLSLAEATPLIRSAITAEYRAELLRSEISNLRKSRHVRIVNDDLRDEKQP